MMALKTLESYIGREKTMELITEVEEFRTYPSDAEYILNVRKKVNELIKSNI